MPGERLELSRTEVHAILSRNRLPIPTPGHMNYKWKILPQPLLLKEGSNLVIFILLSEGVFVNLKRWVIIRMYGEGNRVC